MNLENELLETMHTIYLQLWPLFQPWGILAREWSYTLFWQPSSTPSQNIFNIDNYCFYIRIRQHFTARLTALWKHLGKFSSEVHVRIFNIVIFELKIILYTIHIFPRIRWYINHTINTLKYGLTLLKSIGIYYWLESHIWFIIDWLVSHCI